MVRSVCTELLSGYVFLLCLYLNARASARACVCVCNIVRLKQGIT